MTPDQIIYHRRARVLDQAARTSVAEACRTFGVSRTTYYRWRHRAERYGMGALMPKARRSPAMPNATPAHEVEVILAEAIARPTLGARRLLEHLGERGVLRSASGVQKILVAHGLGRRGARLGALAQITAARTGLVTEEARSGPFGFCHFAARPGDLVGLDSFYVGKLKGVGPVYQLTAVDTATRWAICSLVAGGHGAAATAAFVDHVGAVLAAMEVELATVLTDNGPEFTGHAFTEQVAEMGVGHQRIPPRSPNHNAVCERFQGTALQEFYRPAFHRRRFDSLAQLNIELQGWLLRYNTRRRNHGDYMRGRTPAQRMAELKEAHVA